LKAKNGLKFDRVFPARLIAGRILGEGAWAQPQLLGNEGNELLRRVLARPETLTGIAQQAELDREAEAVRCTAFGSNEDQVVGAEDVVPRHLDTIHGDGEQAVALLGGQKGSDG